QSQLLAQGLASLGVSADAAVATMLPHSIDSYRVWFAISALEALEVPIVTRYVGRMLEHVLNDSGAEILVIDAQYVDQVRPLLESGAVAGLRALVVRGVLGELEPVTGLSVVELQRLGKGSPQHVEAVGTLANVRAHQLALVLYTSGTTGP